MVTSKLDVEGCGKSTKPKRDGQTHHEIWTEVNSLNEQEYNKNNLVTVALLN